MIYQAQILCKGLTTKVDKQRRTVPHKYLILLNVLNIEIKSRFSVLSLVSFCT